MHWGVFAISAEHLYLPKLPWRTPTPGETSERMNFNVIDKKQLIWKLFIYWYLMSFFHKKNVTKCLGHHYAIWPQKNFRALISGTVYTGIQIMIFIQLSFNIIFYNTILGTPVSSTIINWPKRYNWNIVESGVKHS